MDASADENLSSNTLVTEFKRLQTLYQFYLDQSTPHSTWRWIAFATSILFVLLRVVVSQGWYAVCYSLGIYLLNRFIAFLTPKFDVSLQQSEQNDELEAGEVTEEFRPFVRRLPEFKFWYSSMKASMLSLFLMIFPIFDIPVYWPILLFYFVVLFVIMMRRQIQHMIKYHYIPLDIGKKSYNSSK